MTKDQFIAEQESICEQYADMRLTYDQALAALARLGFDPQESRDLLNEAVA